MAGKVTVGLAPQTSVVYPPTTSRPTVSTFLLGYKYVVALQRAEMRMVRWMCGVKLKDRLPSKELRERLGIDDIALVCSKTGCVGMGMCCEKMMMIG